MDPARLDGSVHTGENPHSQQPCRNFARGPWCPVSSCPARKVSKMCRFFQRSFCFHGDVCSYQYPQPTKPPLFRDSHRPTGALARTEPQGFRAHLSALCCYDGGLCWGPLEPGARPARVDQQGPGGCRQYLAIPLTFNFPATAAECNLHPHHPCCCSCESEPKTDPTYEFTAPLPSQELQREQDSRDVVCGICMDKVWDKPENERVFAILPNCAHAHCLSCLRQWRRGRGDIPAQVIKACPQCRVYSSYLIPHKYWVSQGAQKEQLIRSFKARTSQIQCRFFMKGNGRCPFKSDCIYLHQLPAKTPRSDPPWPESELQASGNEVLDPAAIHGGNDAFFLDCALTMAFWGPEFLMDSSSSNHSLL